MSGVQASPRQQIAKMRPFSLRFTESERTRLEHAAGTLSLAAYIRLKLFEDDSESMPKRRATRRVQTPSAELAVIGQMLGQLGETRLAASLDDIAKAASSGALHVEPELETELKQACATVQEIRALLIKALGVRTE